MSVTLRQIECFTAVAELLHFGRAAQRTHMTQPALSRQVAALEAALGVRLLVRGDRAVTLTPAGEAYLEGCREATQVLRAARRRAAAVDAGFAGTLRVGYIDFAISSALPDLLAAHRRSHPDVALEPFQASSLELLGRLEEGRLDVVFVTGPVDRTGIATAPFVSHGLLAILHEGHPLAAKPRLRLADLDGQDLVLGVERLWRSYLAHLDRAFAEAGIVPRVVERGYNSEGLFGLVAAQMGITVYPDCARSYVRCGLVLREVEGLTARIPTVAAWRVDDASSALARFVGLLRGDQDAPCAGGRARRGTLEEDRRPAEGAAASP